MAGREVISFSLGTQMLVLRWQRRPLVQFRAQCYDLPFCHLSRILATTAATAQDEHIFSFQLFHACGLQSPTVLYSASGRSLSSLFSQALHRNPSVRMLHYASRSFPPAWRPLGCPSYHIQVRLYFLRVLLRFAPSCCHSCVWFHGLLIVTVRCGCCLCTVPQSLRWPLPAAIPVAKPLIH